MPSDPQRSQPRKLRTRDAIPLDEVEADFGMKGMLSFLEVPQEEASRALEARRAVDLAREAIEPQPMGHSPTGQSRSATNQPLGHSPMGHVACDTPDFLEFSYSVSIPEVGKRKPFRWTLAQDAHTPAEQNLFSVLMELSRRQHHKLPDGSSLVEASLTDLQRRLRTDHKQVKKLLTNLIEKHAIALERSADPARQIPARYQIFSYQQINEKRRSLDLLWVVKNRGVRLLSDKFVRRLAEEPMGDSPLGYLTEQSESPVGDRPLLPMGQLPESPIGHSPGLFLIEEEKLRKNKNSSSSSQFVEKLREVFEGDCDIDLAEMVWRQGRDAAADISEDELVHFAASIYRKAKQNPNVRRPQSIVVSTIAGHIHSGGLQRYRKQIQHQEEQGARDHEDAVEFWKGIANDLSESEESRLQARDILRDYGVVVESA